jgi:vacuolar-type H+-ATPase subunit C/Vma6
MRDYADEAYLHARLYAMRSRLLSLKDYASLARNQDEPLYGKTVCVTDPSASEEIIFHEQIAGIIPLAEAIGIYSPLFLAFLRQFEALNAKLILAKAFGLQALEQWYDIGPYAVLPHHLFSKTQHLEDILPLLKGTYLSDVLEDVSSYEQMEARVDLCALKDMYDASILFKPDAKLDFQLLMGRRIAVTSLMLFIRLKKTYQWDDGKIRLFLEKFHEVFEGKVWPQVSIVEDTLNRHIEQLRAIAGQEPSVADTEQYMERYYYSWISSMFNRDFHSIYCVVAYLWLLFYQIRNLFRIVEGKRFGLSAEQILGSIIYNS